MQSEHKSEPNETLSIKSQIPKILDRVGSEDGLSFRPPEDAVRLYSGGGGGGSSDHLVKLTVRLFISYSGALPASNVNISVTSPPSLHCLPSNIVLHQVWILIMFPCQPTVCGRLLPKFNSRDEYSRRGTNVVHVSDIFLKFSLPRWQELAPRPLFCS